MSDRTRLRLVTPGPARSGLSAQIAALQAEARAKADEQVDQLVMLLERAASLSAEIVEAEAGLYRAGVVEACRQLASQAPMAAQHLQSIQHRKLP